MTKFTPELEKDIRDFGRMLKLQLDFAAAADMRRPETQLDFAAKNNQTAGALIGLMQKMALKPESDIHAMEAIVSFAEENGSDAGDELKAQVGKIAAVREDLQKVAQERAAAKKSLSGDDMNAVFKKHLTPGA